MALGWTLAEIISKVRATTSRPDTTMMTDATITDYINRYYQYVLPKELKIFWGYTYYSFVCQPNVDQYPAPTGFQTLNPSVWADGFPIEWYLSPDTFYSDYPQQLNKTNVATGDGITNSFTFQISAFPIISGSLYVTDGTSTNTAIDNGTGGFVAPASGSINYLTGSVTVNFSGIPDSGANIMQASQTYMPNRPQAILFYKSQALLDSLVTTRDNVNMFVLRPVPDVSYQIKMEAIQIPSALVNSTDVPFRTDLGPLIAYGASLEIFSDFNQLDQYDDTMNQYNRYKDISMQDTYEEYLYERSIPAF
jgi:hypothetical protein